MLGANFDKVYSKQIPDTFGPGPKCNPPTCFIGSYAPVTPAGMLGPFNTNTYFLKPDRRRELTGGMVYKSANLCKK